MSDVLPFIVVGVASGSVYGLAGLGLTLTYTTTGIFNFAHGALAAAAAFVFFTLQVEWGWPWPLALAIAVAGVGVIGGVLVERLSRSLSTADAATAVVATVGLLLAVQGLIQWRYGTAARQLAPFLSGTAVHIGGVAVTRQQAATVLVGAAAAGAVLAFLRFSRLGVQMRAVVGNPDLLALSGTDPAPVRTAAWIIGSAFAALSGVLIAPFLGLDAGLLTLLVVQAFGAVAIGRFRSLPLTYAGGLALGVTASLLTKEFAGRPSLGGLPSSLPFLVLVVALVIWPPRTVGRANGPSAASDRAPRRWPARTRLAAAAAGLAALVALPHLVGPKLPSYTAAAALVVTFVSLALLVRGSGQISLCHAAFGAVGATAFSHFASSSGLGLPWFAALLLAGAAAVPIGALVAIPAIRLSGVYLALATFGFTILMERVAYPMGVMFGATGSREAPRPSFAGGDTALFYVTAAVAAVCCLLVVVVSRTRLGRLLRGLAESPTALTTNGLSTNVTRLAAFAASAFLAGIAGALLAAAAGNVNGRSFASFNSLLYLVVIAVAGHRLVPSAVVAAGLLAVAPAYVPDSLVAHQALLFGAATVALLAGRGTTIRPRTTRAGERLGASPVRARVVEQGATA
ncbi:MAG: ABC transporter permease [Actinomycetota bacterium]|jgi:branched-subunit amino acid ABC-type transport system permease component